ncbi:hypothetical protein D3C72_1334590 [compost metagenome]
MKQRFSLRIVFEQTLILQTYGHHGQSAEQLEHLLLDLPLNTQVHGFMVLKHSVLTECTVILLRSKLVQVTKALLFTD